MCGGGGALSSPVRKKDMKNDWTTQSGFEEAGPLPLTDSFHSSSFEVCIIPRTESERVWPRKSQLVYDVLYITLGLGWVGSGQLCQLTPMRSLPFRSVSYLTHCGKTIETNCRNGERNKRNKPFVRCHFSFPFLSLFLVQYSAQARHIRGCCYYDYYCIRQFECRHPFLNRRKETVSPLSIYLLFSVAYRFIIWVHSTFAK